MTQTGTATERLGQLWRSLGVRLALFLSLALVPAGLFGVLQTLELVERTNAQAEARLADRTRAAAAEEREAILWALGAAGGLGHMAMSVGPSTADCQRQMADFVANHDSVATVGFIEVDGRMLCSSSGEIVDFSTWSNWAEQVKNPTRLVDFNPEAPISKMPVIVAFEPIFSDDTLRGFMFVSQPHHQLVSDTANLEGAQFKTFNASGDILTSTDTLERGTDLLPRDRALAALATEQDVTFTALSNDGTLRVYSVIRIIDDTVYAMGIWPRSALNTGMMSLPVGLPLFPIVMWLTSLIVAYVAVHRLVVRHIRSLRRHMASFAKDRVLSPPATPDMTQEIAEIYDTFMTATDTILRDEAEMEGLLHEKNVLLKEVHHRVKNNLQLISSIMNMQMRKVASPEARKVVKDLQSRVLSLATIHRNLYRTANLSAVDAGQLLDQLVNQLVALVETGRDIHIETHFDPVVIYPDQAVPVSFLASEAVTNALKHLGTMNGDTPRLVVSFLAHSNGEAELIVENTKSEHGSRTGDAQGSGLGTNLMQAFANQLEGRIETTDTGSTYRLRCTFALQEFVDGDAEAA